MFGWKPMDGLLDRCDQFLVFGNSWKVRLGISEISSLGRQRGNQILARIERDS